MTKNTLIFDKVNEIEILDIINELKNTNSSGIYKMSNKTIKVVKHLIATLLVLLCKEHHHKARPFLLLLQTYTITSCYF